MIRSVTVTNYLGESMKLDLTRPDLSGFIVEKITGLGPGKADINVTEMSTTDGGRFNSARLPKRNIVINLRFYNWMKNKSIEDLRQLSYRYFPIKRELTLTIQADNRTLEIKGNVESNEPDIFSKDEGTVISIICAKPSLYSAGSKGITSTVFSGIVSRFTFPFSNNVDVDWFEDLKLPNTDIPPKYYPIEGSTKVLRFSPNADGSGMTETRQPNSKYVGVGYMPREVLEQENLLKATQTFTYDPSRINGWDFATDGIWTTYTDPTQSNIVVKQIRVSGSTANYIKSLWSSVINIDTIDECCVSLDVKVTDLSSWDVKIPYIIELYDINKTRVAWLDSDINLTNVEPPLSNNEWSRVSRSYAIRSIGLVWATGKTFADVKYFGIRLTLFRNGEIAFRKAKLEQGTIATPWTPAPSDWLADPTNYDWFDDKSLPVIRYSVNADGSNPTEHQEANSAYVGVGYMPREVIENENPAPSDWIADPTNIEWKAIPTFQKTLIMGDIQNRTENVLIYKGDHDIGVTIRIHAIGEARNVTIHNLKTREQMKIDTDKLIAMTGSPIIAGDDINIVTLVGQKSITLIRDGVEINILNCLDRNSDWLRLVKGDNIIAYTADTGSVNLQFAIENRTIYEGV